MKRHYIPVTADVPGAASQGNCALIRKVIRTALAAEGVTVPCEVDVLLTNADVVRHVLVQRIVKAYEDYETAKSGGKGGKR